MFNNDKKEIWKWRIYFGIKDKFYLVKKGEVRVLKDNKLIREIEKGSCIDELSVLINEPRSAKIVTYTKYSIDILTKNNFNKILIY